MNQGDIVSPGVISTQSPSKTNADIILDIPTLLTCPICLTDYQTPEIISGCSQKHHFCKTCFTQYLEHRISESQVIKIVCPQDGCMENIEAIIIEQLVSVSFFEKYKNYQRFQDKTKITCPKHNCSIINLINSKEEFTVCECGTQICNKCQNYWHKDKTCLQAINGELGKFSKKEEIRLCMNCNSIVTKIEGCSLMTCSVCKGHWCWDCGEQALPRHWENCPKTLIPIHRRAFQRLREKLRRVVPSVTMCLFFLIALFCLALSLFMILGPIFMPNL